MSDEILRLIGDGDRAEGGAIPLPDAFIAVVEHLLDRGRASFEILNEVVSDALYFKEARIVSSSWRAWEDFTRDILKRLSAIGVVEEVQYGYKLTEDFIPGKRYEAFPGRSDIGFTVRTLEAREEWNDNTKALYKLRPVLTEIRERYSKVDPWALAKLIEAERLLRDRLDLNQREERARVRKPRDGSRAGIKRGSQEWRELTGVDMSSPTKEFTADYVKGLPAGAMFAEKDATQWVREKIRKAEHGIAELSHLRPAGSSTVAEALHGKDGKSGLVGDGFLERILSSEGRPRFVYRRLDETR